MTSDLSRASGLVVASLALGAFGCGDGGGGTDAAVTPTPDAFSPTPDAFSAADAPASDPTIADIVIASDDFDILEAAILRASPVPLTTPTPLAELLDAPGAYTVFAPNDAAFEASGLTLAVVNGTPPDALRGILLYHGLLTEVPAASVTAGVQTTIAALPIFITTAGGVAINGGNEVTGGADVTATDVQASNGVVHVIDRVLLPPTVEAIARYAGFTTLAGAVESQDLTETLSGEGPFTVFAPTNEAFAALPAVPTGDALTNVLLFHVVGSEVPSSAITATPAGVSSLSPAPWRATGSTTTLSLVARRDGTTARVNGVAVVTADIPATNGVVHVVGSVLLPPSIVDIANAAGFTSLVGAVTSAPAISGSTTVASVLSDSTSRLTVFAPTNEAFAALPAVPTGNALRDVLLYHVLASPEPGIVLSTGLPGSATNLPTQLSGATLPFTPGTPPQVDGQNIVVTDLVATNGVVHVVAGVLTPPG